MTASEARRGKIATIPAHLSFADTLAGHLLSATEGDPARLGEYVILLPNRRAVRAMREAFLRASNGRPLVLPSLRPIGDIDDSELDLTGDVSGSAEDLLPAMPEPRRLAILSQLVTRWRRSAGKAAEQSSAAQAWRLAGALARFTDSCETNEVDLDDLPGLVQRELAAHWQVTLDFLDIVTRAWPELLRERGFASVAANRRTLLDRLAADWSANPPSGPVIAAGSTGSIPATRRLLKVVARLPAGQVILPGFDRDMNDDAWMALDPVHPQWLMKQLVEHIGVDRYEVEMLTGEATASSDRFALLAHALAPAGVSDIWSAHTLPASTLESGLTGVRLLEAENRREEALGIALAMRRALETPGKTAALVTPDRTLARHVIAALARWGLDVDDSAGTDLIQTVPARFLRLLLDLVDRQFAPVHLLALLQHPLLSLGDRRTVLQAARQLDLHVLRGPRPAPGIDSMAKAIGDNSDLGEAHKAVLLDILERLRPLGDALSVTAARVDDLLTVLVRTSESLAGADTIWSGEAGRSLADHIRAALDAGDEYASVDGPAFPALFDAMLAGAVVRQVWGKHPRLFVWGTVEARLQRADLMILGGLNEASWPPDPGSDPWMSRPMRSDFGLPPLEQRIGQAAHDFVQAATAGEVLITRSRKLDGSPAVASRWLFRLQAATGELPPVAEDIAGWMHGIDHVDRPLPCRPPRPRPPLKARPRKLYVTGVEAWMRDPYGLYAKQILGLRKLDPVDDKPGAAQRGVMIHEALERFLAEKGPVIGEAGRDRLVAIGEAAFAASMSQPAVHAFWWPRFLQVADWFVAEMEKRQDTHTVALLEKAGEATVPDTSFTLAAKADRIDQVDESGRYEIIDYKTGQAPSKARLLSGFAPQLPLEAWLAEVGAFGDLSAAPAEKLAFWTLTGGRVPGKINDARLTPEEVAELVQESIEGLTGLVQAFGKAETPYLSNPRPEHAGYGDYDHLARAKEWQNTAWEKKS